MTDAVHCMGLIYDGGHHAYPVHGSRESLWLALRPTREGALLAVQQPQSRGSKRVQAEDVHPDRRLDGVRIHFDYQSFQFVHLSAGYCLDIAVVRDPAQQHAATRVGERGDFVRPGVAARPRGSIAGKDDLLEFSTTVLVQLPAARHMAKHTMSESQHSASTSQSFVALPGKVRICTVLSGHCHAGVTIRRSSAGSKWHLCPSRTAANLQSVSPRRTSW